MPLYYVVARTADDEHAEVYVDSTGEGVGVELAIDVAKKYLQSEDVTVRAIVHAAEIFDGPVVRAEEWE